jgi:hypothetical protein
MRTPQYVLDSIVLWLVFGLALGALLFFCFPSISDEDVEIPTRRRRYAASDAEAPGNPTPGGKDGQIDDGPRAAQLSWHL